MGQNNKHRKPKDSSRLVKTAGVVSVSLGLPFLTATGANAATVEDWEKIAQCESSGLWNRPDGDNGKSSGGLQFQPASWKDALAYLSKNGIDISAYPQGDGHQAYQATKEQQIMAGEALLALQGPGAWTCNAKVGFPLQSTGPHSSMFKGGTNPFGLTPAPTPTPPATPKPVPPVTPTPKPKPPAAKPKPKPKYDKSYLVVRGDTLWSIAWEQRGDHNWVSIYNSNKKVIGADPDLIFPGQRLHIPGSVVKKPEPVKPKPVTPKPKPSKPTPPPVKTGYVGPLPLGSYWIGDSLINNGGCVSRSCGGHSGIDLTAPMGTKVMSVAAGTVMHAGWGYAGAPYGNHVVIKHADGRYTLYAHLSSNSVVKGQAVSAGQTIGAVGSTGNSGGAHLHFEARTSPDQFSASVFLNPVSYMLSHGVRL